nr:ArsR family transcriptional regulator [Alloalcanivorax xenomutans]
MRLLSKDDHYSTNEYLLKSGLHAYGHNVGTDLLRTELAWLAEQGLVVVDEISAVQIPKLTGRGLDVAMGSTIVPGVKRPQPE